MLSSAKPQRRRRVKEVSPARQGWEKVSETKPERRRRESSRRTQPKHAWKLKQGISTLVFECLKRRVTQPSNGTRIPQPLRAGLTSDCSFGAGLWQCTPSSHLNVMKLPRSQRRTASVLLERASTAITMSGINGPQQMLSSAKPQRRRRVKKLAQPARAGKR